MQNETIFFQFAMIIFKIIKFFSLKHIQEDIKDDQLEYFYLHLHDL